MLPDSFGRRAPPGPYDRGGLRGRDPYDDRRGGGRDRDFYDDRYAPRRRSRSRSPPYRQRSWSRSPPPRRDDRYSPRRRDDRSPPRRDTWDSRGPPRRVDSWDGGRDSWDGGGRRESPPREERPPPAKAPSLEPASRADDVAEWTQHLRVLPDGASTLKLAGCSMLAPPPQEVPFWRAAEHGDINRVEALLDAGEPVDQPGGPYGSTALGWAAVAGNVALAKLCLSRGAKPDAKARKGSTPLHMAAWNGDHEEVVALLLEANADPEVTNASGLNPLALARWFDKQERESTAARVFDMDEWRAKWGKPPMGRSGVIARLEAVTGGGTEEPGGIKAEEAEETEEAGGLVAHEEEVHEEEEDAAEEMVKEESADDKVLDGDVVAAVDDAEGEAAKSGIPPSVEEKAAPPEEDDNDEEEDDDAMAELARD